MFYQYILDNIKFGFELFIAVNYSHSKHRIIVKIRIYKIKTNYFCGIVSLDVPTYLLFSFFTQLLLCFIRLFVFN